VLPEKGEWGLGLEVNRMVGLSGMTFSQPTQMISGKYMLDTAHAFRIGVRIGLNSTTTRNRTLDRAAQGSSLQAFPAAAVMKDNVWQRTSWLVGLSLGKESRRGGRLQGIYGYDVLVMLSQSTDEFKYGNKLSASPLGRIAVDESGDAMSSAEFGAANNIDTVPAIQGVNGSARVTKRGNGLSVIAAVRLFAGAEYFFLPKMSIGAEVGWGLGFRVTGRSKTTLESEGTSNVAGSVGTAIRETTLDGDGSTGFSLGHDAYNPASGLSASLKFHLYF
jgi:hypothetical protein